MKVETRKLRRLKFITVLAVASLLGGVNDCKAQSWGLWDAYAAHFMDGGRIVDHQGGDRTTSEGQSYGLFFALVANDRARFDQLLNWTTSNLSQGDLGGHLPGWEWGRADDGQWRLLDANSASDADLWISYTLIEAGRLWSEPKYTALGKRLAERIAKEEVVALPKFGLMLLPGNRGFRPTVDRWVLNPSYLPIPVLTRLSAVNPTGPWGAIAAKVPSLLQQSSRNGFAMDWVNYTAAYGFAPAAAPGHSSQDSVLGSYDAIRVYLWAGMTDGATTGGRQAVAAVPGMAKYLGTRSTPPAQVDDKAVIVDTRGPVGFSAAMIPYLEALGKKDLAARQAGRVESERDATTRLYGHPPTYYDQNLVMFGGGWEERRFRFDRGGELRVKWKKG